MEFGLSYITTVFNTLFAFADTLYTEFGAYPFIYGLFFIFVVVKFLLIPIVGGSVSAGSSDIAASTDVNALSRRVRSDRKKSGV